MSNAFSLVPGKTALLVVDVQRYLTEPDHPFGRLSSCRIEGGIASYFERLETTVIPHLRSLLQMARQHAGPIVYTRLGSHLADGSDLPAWRGGSTNPANGPSELLNSRIFRRSRIEDQAEIGAWNQGFRLVQFLPECLDRRVGSDVRQVMNSGHESAGFGIGQEVGFGSVQGLQQAAGLIGMGKVFAQRFAIAVSAR